MVTTTNDAFGEVAQSVSKVGELVGETAAASKEQAGGIEQVNTAVSEMDSIVQQNASSAEESASASEELQAQAEQLKGFVDDLFALVSGSTKKAAEVQVSKVRQQAATVHKAIPDPVRTEIADQAKDVSPERVIPMADEDFRDF